MNANCLFASLFSALFLVCLRLEAQIPEISTHTDRDEMKVSFYAQNPAPCPYQLQIDLKNPEVVENSQDFPFYQVLAAQSEPQLLFTLKLRNPEDMVVRYSFRYVLGDPQQTQPEENHVYLIPYEHKEKHRVIQGYNGRFSHQRQYALDFKMKEGTPICAARGGRVVMLKEDSKEGGKDASFSHQANRVVIQHRDGTFAYYLHLQYQGVTVELGERVNAGQIIGFSGNTGWSTTPHLHFVVKKSMYMQAVSIPTYFLKKKLKWKYIKAPWAYRAYHPK